jgi:hypothetical protein
MALPDVPESISEAEQALDSALATAVTAAGRQGAPLEELWHAAFAIEPELASSVDRRSRLLASLERLAGSGRIRPWPTRRASFERSSLPSLPLVVRAPPTAASERPIRPVLPAELRPELAGARNLDRIRADEVATLVAVNEFLRDLDSSRPPVPVRERSLEIFGDEKRLESIRAQRLYAIGVLSDELLRCFEVHPPFVYLRVSDVPAALVLENHHTYDSACRLLKTDARDIGVVVYGAGGAFCTSVTYLAELDPAVKQAYYFGDLDIAGLSIPARAHLVGQAACTASVTPAVGLYRALLASPHRRPATPVAAGAASGLVAWLPEELRAGASQLLMSGHWLPQEAVGLEVMSSIDRWL